MAGSHQTQSRPVRQLVQICLWPAVRCLTSQITRLPGKGWLNRPEALQWLYNASILVFPSRWPEPLSRVLLEASAIGIPIAAMDTGGSRDIVVDQKTGLLCQTSDGLAQAVADLYKDERLRQVLAGAAKRRMAAKFSTVNVISQMEALYGQLVGKS